MRVQRSEAGDSKVLRCSHMCTHSCLDLMRTRSRDDLITRTEKSVASAERHPPLRLSELTVAEKCYEGLLPESLNSINYRLVKRRKKWSRLHHICRPYGPVAELYMHTAMEVRS